MGVRRRSDVGLISPASDGVHPVADLDIVEPRQAPLQILEMDAARAGVAPCRQRAGAGSIPGGRASGWQRPSALLGAPALQPIGRLESGPRWVDRLIPEGRVASRSAKILQ